MIKKLILINFMALCLSGVEALAIDVHGHRGSRWTHPENTIPALNEALAAGADVLEFDLGMTADDALILSHDPVIDPRICRRKNGLPLVEEWVIRQRKLAELKRLDCGAMINPGFPSQQAILDTEMPTLEEVFVWLNSHRLERARKIGLNIETKISAGDGESASPGDFAEALVRLVKKYGLQERTVIQSFDFRSLAEARRLDPQIKIALLVRDQNWDEIDRQATELKAKIISPPFRWITKEIMAKAKRRGYEIVPWTVNSEEDWRRMIDFGVDGIITDRPRDLVRYLAGVKGGLAVLQLPELAGCIAGRSIANADEAPALV